MVYAPLRFAYTVTRTGGEDANAFVATVIYPEDAVSLRRYVVKGKQYMIGAGRAIVASLTLKRRVERVAGVRTEICVAVTVEVT